jgi:hypothetical protein
MRLIGTAVCLSLPGLAGAQALTGTILGVVQDEQGAVIAGARAQVASPALIGGPTVAISNDRGQLRFQALPPGVYALDVEFKGFASHHEVGIRIGANLTIEITAVLKLAAVIESVSVGDERSRIDVRDPGFGTRFGPEDLGMIPTRRASMFDLIRAAPGVSPTSPSSGTTTTVSVFGSGTNENLFLFDGTNFTCPCNGVARAEPGVGFIEEVHVQSVGASAEFGNMQGAVVNVITRQGSNTFLFDAAYFGQAAALTSQPVRLLIPGAGALTSGYRRDRYEDLTSTIGGPAARDRVWFFAGYQRVRDYDSQPGADPEQPRTYEQDKVFGKLTWSLAPGWRLVQSIHHEAWVNPEQPTIAKPFPATTRREASVPAMTFGHLTHATDAAVWEVRVGRFVSAQDSQPSTGSRMDVGRVDTITGASSGAPQQFGRLTLTRTTAKASVGHHGPAPWGGDHDWKVGVQAERGSHRGSGITPSGVRYIDRGGQPFLAITRAPSVDGGQFVAMAAFASDAVTVGERLTIQAGLRFDHARAISQDVRRVDALGDETDERVQGLGALYTWNILSPRLGLTLKLGREGRTVLRASYGRFSQGVLTGEISPVHPGVTTIVTTGFDPATGGYTRPISAVDPGVNVQLDRRMRAPRTDELSAGIDRAIGRRVAVAIAYVRKDGANFIGWTDIGGQYEEGSMALPDGRVISVSRLTNATADRRFLLTNPDDYALTYNGLVMAVEKRRSDGWQAFASYTLSRAHGLQPSSGATAAGAQVSTVAPPDPSTFGRDPNSLAHAGGRLPNDRPHMFRLMGSVDVPRTGLVIAGNLQHFSGKPWAATAQVGLPQGDVRILLESRGSRRLSSQTLLDLRISRTMNVGFGGTLELLVDVLNALNTAAEEGIATDNLFSAQFGQPTSFVDPRRAMLGVRLNLGR